MSERKVGSVTYQEVGEDYFQERGLRRHAGVWSLWALGVGAVISGDYYGWNFGLAGGFGGFSSPAWSWRSCTTDSSTRSPRCRRRSPTPAGHTRSRDPLPVRGVGSSRVLAENMEYVITPAVVVGAMGFLMHDVMGRTPELR